MNKPVAWIEPITGNVLKDAEYQNNPFANETGDWIPLYTHPVKELTDEEIIDCVNKEFDLGLKAGHATVLAFARAILRKAQEK